MTNLDITVNKSFCALPWMHLATLPDGSAQYCCLSKEKAKVGDQTGNLGKHTIADLVNSEVFCDTRKKMLAGELVDGCSTCYKEEQAGGSSQRITHTIVWLREFPTLLDTIKSTPADGTILPNIKYMDLRFGNLCNLQCRSCGPLNSSQLVKEADELTKKQIPLHGFQMFSVYPELRKINDWYQTAMFENNIKECYNDIDTLYFTGGEPTLIEQNYIIMEHLVATGRAGSVSLTFNSNITNVQDRFYRLVKEFKSVRINASIDGFGNVQEYLRYPSKWSSIDKNLRRLAEYPNLHICITSVVQSVNLENIVNLFQYVDSINDEFGRYRIELLPIALDSPPYLDLVYLPIEYRKKCLQIINDWVNSSKYVKHDKYAMSRIDLIRSKCVEVVPADKAKLTLQRFKLFTDILDNNRGQCISDVNPFIGKLIE